MKSVMTCVMCAPGDVIMNARSCGKCINFQTHCAPLSFWGQMAFTWSCAVTCVRVTWVSPRVFSVPIFSDLYCELNRLNSSMQGRNTHVIQLYDRIEGFLKKIKRWRDWVREGTFSMFPSVEELCESAVLSPHLTHTIVAHLEALDDEFGK